MQCHPFLQARTWYYHHYSVLGDAKGRATVAASVTYINCRDGESEIVDHVITRGEIPVPFKHYCFYLATGWRAVDKEGGALFEDDPVGQVGEAWGGGGEGGKRHDHVRRMDVYSWRRFPLDFLLN